jgi:hypothetical protein
MVARRRLLLLGIACLFGLLLPVSASSQVRATGRELSYSQLYLGGGPDGLPHICFGSTPRLLFAAFLKNGATAPPETYETLIPYIRRVRRDDGGPAEVEITTPTKIQVDFVAIAADASDRLAVAWSTIRSRSGEEGGAVWFRIFGSALAPLTEDIRVTADGETSFADVRIARMPDGRTMVVWGANLFGKYQAKARVYDGEGWALSDEILLGTVGFNSYQPSVSTVAATGFVISWAQRREVDDRITDVHAQRFSAAGVPISAPVVITRGGGSDIAGTLGGGFAAVWQAADPPVTPDAGSGIYGQSFDSNDAPLGPIVRVSAFIPGRQTRPSIVSDEKGGFVVGWVSSFPTRRVPGQDGSGAGVFGRRLHGDGTVDGFEFQFSTITEGAQGHGTGPRFALAAQAGRVAASWSSEGLGSSEWGGVAARRFRVRPGRGPLCGDAHARDLTLELRDSLKILRVAVGMEQCPACLCDVDGSGLVTANDALVVARKVLAKGVRKVKLNCPVCSPGDEDLPAGEWLLPAPGQE